MPFYSELGEQILNRKGSDTASVVKLDLVRDSYYNIFGLLQEDSGGTRDIYAFFIQGDGGRRTPYHLVGSSESLLIWQFDEEAFILFPENGDYDAVPPIELRSDGSIGPPDRDFEDITPSYRLTEDGLYSYRTGAPAGEDAIATTLAGYATVYTAPDGDGSGIFLRIISEEGEHVGGVTRVNAEVEGDQTTPVIGRHGDAFTVAWAQSRDEDSNALEYRSITLHALKSNLPLAIKAQVGNQTVSGDVGDYQTDIFFYDTAAGGSLGRDRIDAFGINDILVTTSAIRDSDGDGIINFGRDRLLDLTGATGRPVSQVAMSGLRALEFDGAVEGGDGQTYYVYSHVGSEADQHYLIV